MKFLAIESGFKECKKFSKKKKKFFNHGPEFSGNSDCVCNLAKTNRLIEYFRWL